MLELTSKNAHLTVKNCLYSDDQIPENGQAPANAVIVNGVVCKFGFDPEKLEKQKPLILELLSQLPTPFHKGTGSGWSFLNACVRQDGIQWGEHSDVDELLCLGLAVDAAILPLPRDVWYVFPGGVPYFCVDTSV